MSFKLPPLQTVTQCASLVTATRAIWELSRMVRQKKREVDQTKEVEDLLDEIEEFVHEGVLTKREWKAFCFTVEEALSKKECTPREAQAKVLDFLEALHSIAQEFQEEDGAYLSEPDDVAQLPTAHRHRIEHKAPQPRRDSAVNTSRESQPPSRTAAYPPSPRLPRSQTAPSPDLRPRRASAPIAHHHYHARPSASTVPATPRDSVPSIPHVPVAFPGQFQNGQQYRPPRHSVASPSATPAASGTFSPGASAGAFSPGHMLPNQPTYYPNAPPSMFAPDTASPFASGIGGLASRAYSHGGSASPAGHASPTFHVNGTASPPHPNYSGPLPVPPSRSFTQHGWGPLPTQAPGGPTSPALAIPAQNTWSANTTFPFPNFPESRNRGQSNSNSNRPSVGSTSSPHSHSSSTHKESTSPAEGPSPAEPASNAASSPIVPPSPSGGSTSARVNGWDSQHGSPHGFMSPTQEAQAQRTAAAKLREHEHRQNQVQALSEEIGMPDLDIPPPPNAPCRQQQKPSINWASDLDNDRKVKDTKQTIPPTDSVSEAGTYMSPTGEKNKRRRRRQ